jgi:hypothetical protein
VPPPTAREERQNLLAHHVRLVARKVVNGLFVAGQGGLGKSHTISRTLAEEGVCPVLINSHITPLSLYAALFHNRADAVIWLDDADSIYTSMPVLGLLRSAVGPGRACRHLQQHAARRPAQLVPVQLPDHLLREHHPQAERGVPRGSESGGRV